MAKTTFSRTSSAGIREGASAKLDFVLMAQSANIVIGADGKLSHLLMV